MTTAPLPPYYLPTTPLFQNIEDLIQHLWDYGMDLEEQFYKTNKEDVLEEFAFLINVVQYWEDVAFQIREDGS